MGLGTASQFQSFGQHDKGKHSWYSVNQMDSTMSNNLTMMRPLFELGLHKVHDDDTEVDGN